MKKLVPILCFISMGCYAHSSKVNIIKNETVKKFGKNGSELQGLATPSKGSKQFEVWQSKLAIGEKTPKHKHESDEVFVFLKGKAKAIIGEKEYIIEAPATVIAPANIEHQLFNIGKTATHQIVIIGAGSKIWDAKGEELLLPWRK